MKSSIQQKIVSLDDLHATIERARTAGQKVVQCHGCFDIVHPGHIRYLEFARRQGDVLVVSLTGDADIHKGDERPYIPQELRAENLAALMVVDFVYIDPNPTARETIEHIRPHVYVKGAEYEDSTDPNFIAERRAVENYGGRIIFSSGDVVFSSSRLIQQRPGDESIAQQRLGLLAQRHRLTAGRMQQTLKQISGKRVLVIGDVVVDRYVLCDVIGAASESPMLSLEHLEEQTFVGGAGIVARHAAAMGANVTLVTAQGEDDLWQQAAGVLDDEGVAIEPVDARPQTVLKTRFIGDDQKLFKLDRGRRQPLDSATERKASERIASLASDCDVALLCDFGYGVITGGLLTRILPVLRNAAGIVAADISGGRGNLLSYKHVDLLCPTEREVRALLNDNDAGISAIAWDLLQMTQARHLIITLEKRGLLSFERRSQQPDSAGWSARLRSEQLPSFTTHPVDTLGCGDALLTTTALALATGATLPQAAYMGNAAAAVKASTLGNRPVSSRELMRWFADRPELDQTRATKMKNPRGIPSIAGNAGASVAQANSL